MRLGTVLSTYPVLPCLPISQHRVSIGGHLAAQAVANAAATAVFAAVVHIHLVSYVPTALRVGAGCGISILVSVLGMRSMGLLLADSFTLQPFTWEIVSKIRIIFVLLCLPLGLHISHNRTSRYLSGCSIKWSLQRSSRIGAVWGCG